MGYPRSAPDAWLVVWVLAHWLDIWDQDILHAVLCSFLLQGGADLLGDLPQRTVDFSTVLRDSLGVAVGVEDEFVVVELCVAAV